MEYREVKIFAAEMGYRLVPVDAIRTATASVSFQKHELSQIPQDQHADLIVGRLAHDIAKLIVGGIPISQLPHETTIEYRVDVTVIREPVIPTSQDYFLRYTPLHDPEKKW